MKKLIALLGFVAFFSAAAQENPVKFDFSQNADTLIIEASIEQGWHLYAAHLPHPNEGPLPTEIIVSTNENIQSNGPIVEGLGHTEMDDAFGIEVKYFEEHAIFKQALIIHQEQVLVSGSINYMVCNDNMCIPFEVPFEYTFLKN
jgi:hypothetical protein